MNEHLVNSHNNEGSNEPTGWEQLENHISETSDTPTSEQMPGEQELSHSERLELTELHEKLELLKQHHPELSNEFCSYLKTEARKRLVNLLLEGAREYGDKLAIEDFDGDGLRDDYVYKDPADSSAISENPDSAAAFDIKEMSNEELDDWLSSLLSDEAAPSHSEKETLPPIATESPELPPAVTEVPGWLDSWEDKKKNL
jgi:hypothetical protein